MITIVGAGMAGLLAGNMLFHRGIEVLEAQPELPNNHSAVLRFRTDIVSQTLNIPFKKVNLVKAVAPWRNEVADAMAYSYKNTGVRRSDRSITYNPQSTDRWIAPPDLVSQMAKRLDGRIKFNEMCHFDGEGPFISTMPMPELMLMMDYHPKSPLEYKPGTNIKARINDCDAYVSLMVPDPRLCFSRLSITGNELIVEIPKHQDDLGDTSKDILQHACFMLGLNYGQLRDIQVYHSRYAKILPMDDVERKNFIFEASHKHGIFSLGRFATWRPGLLMDDLVKDIRQIERWIENPYSTAMGRL